MSKGQVQRPIGDDWDAKYMETFDRPIHRERCGHVNAYQALYPPRCGCRACWDKYDGRNVVHLYPENIGL